jgi:prolipoprotein diacylglyceryltransferase
MTGYLIQTAATIAAVFGLFAAMLKRNGQKPALAAAALPVCTALALILAKVFYVLLLQLDYILEWGEWEVFLEFEPKRLCFVGGAAGVWLGIRAAAALMKQPPRKALDAFAAPGALLIAGIRLGEAHLGKLGAGSLLEGGILARAPFAVTDTWGDKYLAVFVLEALAALVIAVWAWRMKEERDGIRFEKTVFALALCQIMLENLRNQAMKWGFVYVEQILCAVILMALMLLACSRKQGGWKRFLPALWLLLCMGGIVGEEFARQKGSSEILADFSYVLMVLILAVMGWLYAGAIRGERPNGE